MHADYVRFDPRAFLDEFYSLRDGRVQDNITWSLHYLSRVVRLHGCEDSAMISVGSGPSIEEAIAAAGV